MPAVALNAAAGLIPASWRRLGDVRAEQVRWASYVLAGGTAAAALGPYLVLILIGCGMTQLVVRRWGRQRPIGNRLILPLAALHTVAVGGLAAVCWVAIKVGALSYGGGFVIIPLMQHDAVSTYHWMTGAQFLNAVALGQITPGPVVQTVAVVGYAAAGVGGGLLAALIAFTPSFVFVLSAAPDSIGSAPTPRSRPSSPAQDQPSSAPSRGQPSRLASPSDTSGSFRSWAARCCGCSPHVAASSADCSSRRRWASSQPWCDRRTDCPRRSVILRASAWCGRPGRFGALRQPNTRWRSPRAEQESSARVPMRQRRHS